MKKFFKKSVLFFVASFFATAAMAGEDYTAAWTIEPFSIGAGQVKTVKVLLTNSSTKISTIAVLFNLPDGIEVAGVDYTLPKKTTQHVAIECSSRIAASDAANIDFNYKGSRDLQYKISSDLITKGISGESGTWVFAFDVKCADGVAEADGVITFGECIVSNDDGDNVEATPADVSVAVSDKFIVDIPASGVCTICSSVDLDMSGLNAYYVKEIVDKKVKGVKIDGALKAGEGAVLQGEANSQVKIPVATSSAAAPEKNMLVGVTKFTKFTDVTGIYFMSGGKFKKAAANGTLGAGKAYLDSSKAGAKGFDELEFVVEEDVTAIKTVETEQNAGVLYNLNGVRVDNPTKGVYIQNGRKVIVK